MTSLVTGSYSKIFKYELLRDAIPVFADQTERKFRLHCLFVPIAQANSVAIAGESRNGSIVVDFEAAWNVCRKREDFGPYFDW